MIGLRLAGVVLMGAALAGCDTKPNNVAETIQTGPLLVDKVPPVTVVAPKIKNKILKNKQIYARSATASAPAPVQPASDYHANGTEPFWAVTVRDATATLERPDHPPVRFLVVRDVGEGTIHYRGKGFAMTVNEGPCNDGMSDTPWRDRVAVAFAEGVLKGCGGDRDEGQKKP